MLKVNQVSMGKLYFGKLLCSFIIILPVQLILFLIFIIATKVDGITLDLSLQTYFKWLFLAVLASFPIITLQSYVTVKTRNFSKSVGLATIGSMFNFVLIFINEDLTKFFPYSQPMIALRSRSLADMSLNDMIIFLAVNIFYSFVFYKFTVGALEKR
ncbi:putative bacteroiocin operon protein [Streptococcus mitis]|nr:putative bacteroiocin operon protein [Streptococcus mitis]